MMRKKEKDQQKGVQNEKGEQREKEQMEGGRTKRQWRRKKVTAQRK